jgi:uncharacterized protein
MMRKAYDYIETFSGVKFFPFDPRPEDINIIDIAHALSKQCRFGGHPKIFYSVAQHSLFVAQLLREKGADALVQLYGLLHDATECYMVDLPSPIKRQLPKYKRAEKRLHVVIWEGLSLPAPTEEQWKLVKEVDALLLHHEAVNLLPYGSWADHSVKLENIEIVEENRADVVERFLEEYKRLRDLWEKTK